MKVLLNGHLRRVHTHTLLDGDISKIEPKDDGWYGRRQISIQTADSAARLGPDEFVIGAVTSRVRIGGNFIVKVLLSKSEIAHLARIALGNDSFADAVDKFSARTGIEQ